MHEPSPYLSALTCALALTLGACAQAPEELDKDDNTVLLDEGGELDGVLEINSEAGRVSGSFHHAQAELSFEAERDESSGWVTAELRGMTLLLTYDPVTGAFDIDGFDVASGQDTQMTAADRAILQSFDRALGVYLDDETRTPAAQLLLRAVTAWGDYSDTLPLQRTYYGTLLRSAGLCNNVNKPGQGTSLKYVAGTHDCNDTAGDCSNWTGCDHWDDNSTTDKVVMSMHPGGSCSDDTYFGGSATSMSCKEPDHPSGNEFAHGACFGRCGGGCGSGTQFTRACLDHDQCVRLGHSIASLWCDDHLVDATWDAINANDCSGVNFDVDYNFVGTSTEGNCSTGWRNANDGCDVGCQFVDGDCFR